MPRELRDVLDYFLPEAEAEPTPPPEPPSRALRPAALPIVAIPIGDRDVVRAAFAWNLAVEVAREGADAVLVAPEGGEPSPLWPASGRGPLGAETVFAAAGDLGDLNRAALDVAVARAADAADGGLVIVQVPPAWLVESGDARALLRWTLLFTSVERRDLLETYGLTKRVLAAGPQARIGITVHGARRLADAERAFTHLAGVTRRRLGQTPVSYGLLVVDLHVYRAIVARRPIGLERPQSPAARALRDVAGQLLSDARAESLG